MAECPPTFKTVFVMMVVCVISITTTTLMMTLRQPANFHADDPHADHHMFSEHAVEPRRMDLTDDRESDFPEIRPIESVGKYPPGGYVFPMKPGQTCQPMSSRPMLTEPIPQCTTPFLYMVSTPEDIETPLLSALASDRSRVIVLSWRKRSATTDIFFPKSTVMEARNRLYAHGKQIEQDEFCTFMYFTFIDGDAVLGPQPAFDSVRKYEDALIEWEPAVGTPGYRSTALGGPVGSVLWHDGCMNSIHHEAQSHLLPYDDSQDRLSVWISQQVNIYKAMRYMGHVLMFHVLSINNPTHGEYARNPESLNAEDHVKALNLLIPDELRQCVEPALARGLGPGWDWGTAPQKKSGSYNEPTIWSQELIDGCYPGKF